MWEGGEKIRAKNLTKKLDFSSSIIIKKTKQNFLSIDLVRAMSGLTGIWVEQVRIVNGFR